MLTRWWMKDPDPLALGTVELILIREAMPRRSARLSGTVAIVLFCLVAFAAFIALVPGAPDSTRAPTPPPITLVLRPPSR
ncbi:MAG: hypothetical protein AB7W59_12745 [Acidimicrobiia bacterium]